MAETSVQASPLPHPSSLRQYRHAHITGSNAQTQFEVGTSTRKVNGTQLLVTMFSTYLACLSLPENSIAFYSFRGGERPIGLGLTLCDKKDSCRHAKNRSFDVIIKILHNFVELICTASKLYVALTKISREKSYVIKLVPICPQR